LKIDTEQNQTKDQKKNVPPVAQISSVEDAGQNPNKTPEKKFCKREPKWMMEVTHRNDREMVHRNKGKERRRKGNVPGLMC
jgi:hypothetical protein